MTPTLEDHRRALDMMSRMADCDLPIQQTGTVARWAYLTLERVSRAYALGNSTSARRGEFTSSLAHAEHDCQLAERHGAAQNSQ